MLKYKEMQEKKFGKPQVKPKNQKWKKQSEEFRAILRQNRNIPSSTGKTISNK
jgi:hypothetical protein